MVLSVVLLCYAYQDNEWFQKYTELSRLITSVSQLREKVLRLPHPGVVYDLVPYVTEINTVLTMVLDYFRWMGKCLRLLTRDSVSNYSF